MTEKPSQAAQIEAANREAVYTSIQTLMLQAAYTDCTCHSCKTLRILGRAMTASLGERLDSGRRDDASSETTQPQTPSSPAAESASSDATPSVDQAARAEPDVDHSEESGEAATALSEASVTSTSAAEPSSPDSGGPR